MERSLFVQVLAVVRRLGGCTDLEQTFAVITDAIVDVLGFGAAAINVTTSDGDVRVDAVVGPPGVDKLLGSRRPIAFWVELLAIAEPWGELRFFSHERDQSTVDRFPTWTPDRQAGSAPDAWHPDDSLLAPMWDGQGRLVGVLSVDEPRTGRRPGPEQRTVLEVFAGQAAKAIREAQVHESESAARNEAESRWRLAFEQSRTGAALLGVDGRFLQVNDSLCTMLGYPAEQLTGLSFTDITHPEDIAATVNLFAELASGKRKGVELEKRYLHNSGSVVHVQLSAGVIRDVSGMPHTIISQVIDVTERRHAQQLLAHQRTHDALTGLANHSAISDRLAHRLALGEPAAVLLCDVDRFKTVNNSLGRGIGDQLLIAVADRLKEFIPAECEVGRIGDDEFIVLIPDPADREAVERLGRRLLAAMRLPLHADTIRHTMSISIGAACSGPGIEHSDELMADAGEALRRAKRRGRARVEFYDPAQDHPRINHDLQLEQDLRAALTTGEELRVFLQPIVNIDDEAVIGAEALVRWQHPQRGLLEPAAFLPLAEHSGLVVDLGWHMLTLGARTTAQQLHHNGENTWVAINVSGHQLGRGELPDAVGEALETHHLPAASLHLEITESALVEATPQALREIEELGAMGISIALDDFGTGYSSLSLLRDLPISIVKIDRSFTAPIGENRRTAALVRSVVGMCDALGIKTIAEGIETREQLALVSALGCHYVQGYLFGAPEAAGVK